MKLTIYRIFSFLLLPIAVLFSMGVLTVFRAAFANPLLFIPIFFSASIAIYTFASLNFLIRGIDGKKLLGRTSKDWLIVNALVSIIYALTAIAQRFLVAIYPEVLKQYADNMKENAGSESAITSAQILQYLNGVSYFLLIYGMVLFIHIIFSFYYIKKYNYLFKEAKSGS